MPEILKKPNGDTDYTKLFMAFAAAIVLILQQWQTYKIAELKAEAEVSKVKFLDKEKVYAIENDLENRLLKLEEKFVPANELIERFDNIERRLDALEEKK